MGKRPTQAPTIESKDKHGENLDVYQHPAFGVVSMSIVNGGDRHLFGSDVQHSSRIRIEVKRAKLERTLSNDWIFETGFPIVGFEMSQAQFAQFITSGGRSGTPVTLTEAGRELIPSIQPIESKANMFRREVKQAGQERVAGIMKTIKELGELIESGKLSKGELRSIHNRLSHNANSLPTGIDFVVEQANEAIEMASQSAKIDIEAFIANQVEKLGVEAAQRIGLTSMPQQQDQETIGEE